MVGEGQFKGVHHGEGMLIDTKSGQVFEGEFYEGVKKEGVMVDIEGRRVY